MSKIKVCGINDLSCLDSVQKFKPDYLGFITCQNSPRYIDANFLKQAQEFIDDEITPVIVFVNEKISFINEIINIIPNALLQFHGNETDEFCAQFNRPYWKAIHVKDETFVDKINLYPNADAILLESYSPQASGGTGKYFNWDLLNGLEKDKKKFILAGGVGNNNFESALKLGLWCLDVNSSLETSPGKKSEKKIKEFFQNLRNYEKQVQ